MNVSMVNLERQYKKYKQEIDAAIHAVLDSTHYILGPNVKAFEQEVAQYCDTKHAISVASGTDALHLALRAAGIGAGDEVITTAFTFIGTAEAISYTGAKPVFIDIDPDTFNMDITQIEAAISEKTRAVIPVHLYGNPAEIDGLKRLCKQHNLLLIEDCAQSFGATYDGKKTGSLGDFGCFSFYPSKNLGAFGDGGMIVTNNDDFAETIQALRNHGAFGVYQHHMIGYNSRLDEMQAAILRVKLKYIDDFNAGRRSNASQYTEKLQQSDIITPVESQQGFHIYHQYTIRSDDRDRLRAKLTDAGIASAVHYPLALHQQPVYREACKDLYLPVSEQAAQNVLCLPMYPELNTQEIDMVCQALLSTG